MTAFNIVRFRVKPGHQEQFIAKHRRMKPNVKGFRGGCLVQAKTHSASWANG
jgi:heme-degrading monooxygenase HmoA